VDVSHLKIPCFFLDGVSLSFSIADSKLFLKIFEARRKDFRFLHLCGFSQKEFRGIAAPAQNIFSVAIFIAARRLCLYVHAMSSNWAEFRDLTAATNKRESMVRTCLTFASQSLLEGM
jgi:hypothetical protein